MQVGTCPNMLEYTSLPDSTPQRHTVTIPGIKLLHLVYSVLKSHNQKMQVGGILYNLAKVFESVKHDISLEELHF